MCTLFYNASVFQGDRGFVRGSFLVSDGRIREILPDLSCNAEDTGIDPSCSAGDTGPDPSGNEGDTGADPFGIAQDAEIDLGGMYVIPGLVDIHTHGNSGHDFSDADLKGLIRMGRYLAFHGVTSFAPTSMTLPYERLRAVFQTAADYVKRRPHDAARMAGIHMEGPFFSEKRKGAQNSAWLKNPDTEGFLDLQEKCGGLIRIVDVAPELHGAQAFIRNVSPLSRVSVAHTDASYEQARDGFEAGATHLTHLFNGMPPVHHRAPGVIGAAAERDDVTAELICDGLHVHPSAVRMAFRLFPGRICLISDALRCCGMPDGVYELGGQAVILKDGQARIKEGNLAGAVSDLYTDMVNAIRFGITPEEAIQAATIIPAGEVGMDQETGSLEAGKRADFLVCDPAWNLKKVYIDGREIRTCQQIWNCT